MKYTYFVSYMTSCKMGELLTASCGNCEVIIPFAIDRFEAINKIQAKLEEQFGLEKAIILWFNLLKKEEEKEEPGPPIIRNNRGFFPNPN